MVVIFWLSKMDTLPNYEGVCDICGKKDTEGYYQSIHDQDCVETFRGSDCGHKQCLIVYRNLWKREHNMR